MTEADIVRLIRQLESTDIGQCTFQDADGSSLVLRFADDLTAENPHTASAPPLPALASAAPKPSGQRLRAPRFGIFLHRHPLSSAGEIAVGREVLKGQEAGFIVVEDVLVPVIASESGIVREILAPNEALVGYGQHLAVIS